MNLSHKKEIKDNVLIKMATIPDIKKRENIRQNEVIYVTVPNEKNIPNEFGDRFIPRRYAFGNSNQMRNSMNKQKQQKEPDVMQTRLHSGYWRKFNYQVQMSNVFGVKSNRIYQFNDECVNSDAISYYKVKPPIKFINHVNCNKSELDWECKPRPRPCAFIDSTHDLPGFKLYSYKKIIDWSHRGQIGASFGQDLVIWTCETDKTVVYHTKAVTALRFSPDGDFLALASEKMEKPLIEIWSMKKTNALSNTLSLADSFLLSEDKQIVTYIEWQPNGTHILCGMNTGKLFIVDCVKSETTELCNHLLGSINSIKFNVDAKYLATSDCSAKVIIFKWPTCKVQLKSRSVRTKTIFDWHPWNPTDIAIATSISISIVNIKTKQIVAHYVTTHNNLRIDAMAFNKISAEMVVSYCIKNPDGCLSFEILVMASLNRIVDVLKCHEDSVRFLLFSPDGRQLAAAGDDDMLSIFNFFTPSNYNAKNNYQKLSSMNITKESEIFKMQIR